MRIKGQRNRQQPAWQRLVERFAVAILLLIAWGWIMVTFGMLFYHGYRPKSTQKQNPVRHRFNVPSENSPNLVQSPVILPGRSFQKSRQGSSKSTTSLKPYESPLLIFTCNRDEYLKETLGDVQKYLPSDCSMGCPIVVSQDGSNPAVAQVIQDFQTEFAKQGIPLVHLQHPSSLRRGTNAYQALAVHYGWALQKVFVGQASGEHGVLPQRVLILEEDLHIAPDFFYYFTALAPILDQDTSLFAVSAFNDNGFEGKVQDAQRLLRSDFFPGLGWLMTRKLWNDELQNKWPKGYWDDWLRDSAQRQGRQVIRPEISRTFHFGVKGGASFNQFGSRLSHVLLNPTPIDWSQQDLSYLQEDRYNHDYLELIQEAKLVTSVDQALQQVQRQNVRIEYTNFHQFKYFAKALDLMDDEKAGIYRTAFHGVVETRPQGQHILFLTPPFANLQREMSAATAKT